MRTRFLGIDPGKSGGLAMIEVTPDGSDVDVSKMPASDSDLVDLVRQWEPITLAALEVVHSSPQMGVKSAFTFGVEFGRVRAALAFAGIPSELVRPQRWQTVLGCMSGGNKGLLKARAQLLFPATKITMATADAVLLAEYARRFYFSNLAGGVA